MNRMGRHLTAEFTEIVGTYIKGPEWIITINFRWGDILVLYQHVRFTKTLPDHLGKEDSLIKSYA